MTRPRLPSSTNTVLAQQQVLQSSGHGSHIRVNPSLDFGPGPGRSGYCSSCNKSSAWLLDMDYPGHDYVPDPADSEDIYTWAFAEFISANGLPNFAPPCDPFPSTNQPDAQPAETDIPDAGHSLEAPAWLPGQPTLKRKRTESDMSEPSPPPNDTQEQHVSEGTEQEESRSKKKNGEENYRKRLNVLFDRLQESLQASNPPAPPADPGVDGDDPWAEIRRAIRHRPGRERLRKGEVLELARKRILDLVEENAALEKGNAELRRLSQQR